MTTSRPVALLDLDGTLSDNFEGIARSIAYAVERLGVVPPPLESLRGCVGPPLRTTFPQLLGSRDKELVERAVAFYRERFGDVGWRENAVYPGIPEARAALGERKRLLVCTSKPQPYAERIVAHFGFAPPVDRVFGADLAGRLDDKRRLLAHVLEVESLDPMACTMVGDRHHDLRAAQACGTRMVGVLWGYGTREELSGADALVAEVADLAATLARLDGQPASSRTS